MEYAKLEDFIDRGKGEFRLESSFINARIRIEPDGGDGNRVTIAFEQPANGVDWQGFDIRGSIEWGEFVGFIKMVDKLHTRAHRTGTVTNQDNDGDFWQDIEFLAYAIDGAGLQGSREKIQHFLEHTHCPDPVSSSLQDFRQYAAIHLLRTIVGPDKDPMTPSDHGDYTVTYHADDLPF
jgi:hypothetical protein